MPALAETTAKNQVFAHWDNLAEQKTPKAVQQLANEGLGRSTPTEGKIKALECLARIGTTEAVDEIANRFLCDYFGEFSGTVQRNVVAYQFAALFKIGTEEAAAGAFKLIEAYQQYTFHNDDFSYDLPEMSQDLDTAYELVKTSFAREVIAQIGQKLPYYTGAARAILMNSKDKDFKREIKDFTDYLQANVDANMDWVRHERASHRINRVMRDVAPFSPQRAMLVLVELADIAVGSRGDEELSNLVQENIANLLEAYPKHQQELLFVVALNSDKEPFEEALGEYLDTLPVVKRQAAERYLIDLYSDSFDEQHRHQILDLIDGKSPKLIEYGLRKILASSLANADARDELISYFPDHVGMIVDLLTEAETPNRQAMVAAREFANWKGGKVSDKFREYCLNKNTPHTVSQLRHINGGKNAVNDLLSLDNPTAYQEIGKLGPQFAVKGAVGMLAKRTEALRNGVNDVSVYDAPIKELIGKLIKPATLIPMIDKGQTGKLTQLFGSVAEAEIVDVRPVLRAAVALQKARRNVALTKGNFDSALQAVEFD